MNPQNLSVDAYRKIEDELLPGETLLWAGKPSSAFGGMFYHLGAPLMMLGTLFFLVFGFGAFFMVSSTRVVSDARVVAGPGFVETTSRHSGAVLFPFIMIMLVIVLLAALKVWRSHNALYAITDRRALIIRNNAVQSYGGGDIRFIQRRTNRDGTGDLIFDQETRTRMHHYGSNTFAPRIDTTPVGFLGIPNVREVEALMLETFKSETRKRKHDDWDVDDADKAYFYEDEEAYSNTNNR